MDYIEALHRQGERSQAQFGWLVYIGTLNIILGILAVAFTNLSTLFTVLYLGWLLIFSAVSSIFMAYKLRHVGGYWSFLILGTLALVCGILMVLNPHADALVLTLFVVVVMFTTGWVSLLSCFFTQFPHKFWVGFNAVIAIFCAYVIYASWPFSGTWVPGTFLGIYLIFHGFTQVKIGSSGQRFFSRRDPDKAKA
jgi:uncharacterized membrane protein HdeD (DUF308 family)